MNTEILNKIIASQIRGCGCWVFGVFDTLDDAKKTVAQELGFNELGNFEFESCRDSGSPLFFDTIAEEVENYEEFNEYDETGDDGFKNRDEFIQHTLNRKGFD